MSTWRQEWYLLIRDRGAVVVLLAWCLLLIYAGAIGFSSVQALRADQAQFVKSESARSERGRGRIQAIEAGTAEADPYVGFPSMQRSPVNMGIPTLAALDVGIFDRSNTMLRISLFSGPAQAGKGRELQSPLLLTAGRFDLGFVAIVLLPLALMALLYAQPGADREAGRFPLLAAQRALPEVYRRRHALRLLALLLPLIVVSAVTVAAVDGSTDWLSWLLWLLPLLAWAALWSGACAWLVSRTGSAGGALAWLVALWVALLWVIPAVLDSAVERIAPTPSALALLSSERRAAQEAQVRRTELFGNYVSDHPELSINTEADALAWTRSYYVQQRFIADAMEQPRIAAAAQRQAQQRWRQRLSWLSPTQALSANSEGMAGSDQTALDQFLQSAEAHKQRWDEALFRSLLAGQGLSVAEFDRLPAYSAPDPKGDAMNALGLLIQLSLLAGLLWYGARWRVLAG